MGVVPSMQEKLLTHAIWRIIADCGHTSKDWSTVINAVQQSDINITQDVVRAISISLTKCMIFSIAKESNLWLMYIIKSKLIHIHCPIKEELQKYCV